MDKTSMRMYVMCDGEWVGEMVHTSLEAAIAECDAIAESADGYAFLTVEDRTGHVYHRATAG